MRSTKTAVKMAAGGAEFWPTGWQKRGTYQPTKPKFREMQFVANKLIALSYATEEQLADGPAWQAYVNEAVPQELAFQIDTAVYSGPGAGAPLGILNSGAVLVVPKVGGQAAATIVTANITQDVVADVGAQPGQRRLVHQPGHRAPARSP